MKKIMKKLLFALVCTAGLWACAEHDVMDETAERAVSRPETTGEKINIGLQKYEMETTDTVTEAFMNQLKKAEGQAGTRTTYSGDGWISSEIQWKAGDRISIMQVARNGSGVIRNNDALVAYDYTVDKNATSSTITYLRRNQTSNRAQGDAEMEWYANASGYRFFATYPQVSSTAEPTGILSMTPDETAENRGVKVKIAVPKKQVCKVPTMVGPSTNGVWAAEPDMRNCYMVGAVNGNYKDNMAKTTSGITIDFKPAMSCMMVMVRGRQDDGYTKIKGLRVYLLDNANREEEKGFPDRMTLAYRTLGYKKNGTQKQLVACNKPIDNPEYDTDGQKYIEVTFEGNAVFDIPVGNGVVIPVFLPTYVYQLNSKHLKVIPLFEDDAYMKVAYVGNKANSTFLPSSKMLHKLSWVTNMETWNWMAALPDAAKIGNLSLPGAFNAGWRPDESRGAQRVFYQQMIRKWGQGNMTLKNMLDAGVRALDYKVACYNRPINPASFGNFMTEIKTWGSTDRNQPNDWQDVIDFLSDNPTETVLMMIARQETFNSDPQDGAQGLYDFVKYLHDNKVPSGKFNAGKPLLAEYDPNMTLGDCRGRIIVFVRPGSEETSHSGNWGLGGANDDEFKSWGVAGVGSAATNYFGWQEPAWDSPELGAAKGRNMYTYKTRPNEPSNQAYTFVTWGDGNPNLNGDVFWPTKYHNAQIWYKDNQTATIRFYDHAYMGNMRKDVALNPNPVRHDLVTYIPAFSSNPTVNDFRLYDMQGLFAADMVNRAMFDASIKNDWVFTVVPGMATWDAFDTYQYNKYDNNWVDSYEQTHRPTYNMIKNNMGRRTGVVFMNFVPKVTWNGNTPTHAAADGRRFESQNWDGFKVHTMTLGKQLTELIIKNNFMYDTTR